MKEADTKEQPKSIFGIPVVIGNWFAPNQIWFGSWPKPERDPMTIEEYAEQCAPYWVRADLDKE